MKMTLNYSFTLACKIELHKFVCLHNQLKKNSSLFEINPFYVQKGHVKDPIPKQPREQEYQQTKPWKYMGVNFGNKHKANTTRYIEGTKVGWGAP